MSECPMCSLPMDAKYKHCGECDTKLKAVKVIREKGVYDAIMGMQKDIDLIKRMLQEMLR